MQLGSHGERSDGGTGPDSPVSLQSRPTCRVCGVLAVRQVDSDFSGQTQKRTCGGYNLNQFRCYYEATEAKTVRCQPQGRHVDQQTGRGANPRTCGWMVLTRAPRPFSRKDGLCNRWCWESWTSPCERMNLDPPQHHMNSKWIKHLNLRPKTKLLEENTGHKLHDTELGNDFLGMTPKALATEGKRQPTGARDLLAGLGPHVCADPPGHRPLLPLPLHASVSCHLCTAKPDAVWAP